MRDRKMPQPTWLERGLSKVMPGTARRLWHERAQFELLASYSHADKGDPHNRERSLIGGSADRHLDSATLWDLREICRELETENGLAVSLLDTACANIIGPEGYDLEPDTGDDDLNRFIEDDWNAFLEVCDVTGEEHGWDLIELAYRSENRDGDMIWQIDPRANDGEGGFLLLEGDRCFSPKRANVRDSYTVVNGFVKQRGRSVGCWIADDNHQHPYGVDSSKGKWLRDGEFWHWKTVGASKRRATQTRGLPIYTTIIRSMDDLDDLFLFERIGAKLVAAQGYFIETDNPVAVADALQDSTKTGSGIDRVENVVPGAIHWLSKGSKPHSLQSNRPSDNFEPFVKMINRDIGLPFGVPYEMVTKDFSGMSFSTSRMMMNVAARAWRCKQVKLGRKTSQIYRWWGRRRIDRGAYDRWASKVSPQRMLKHGWGYPGWSSPNPMQDAQAAEIGITGRFESRRNYNRTRGISQERIEAELDAEGVSAPPVDEATAVQVGKKLQAMTIQAAEAMSRLADDPDIEFDPAELARAQQEAALILQS